MATRPKRPHLSRKGPGAALPLRVRPPLQPPTPSRQRLKAIEEVESRSALEVAARLTETLPGRVPISRLLVSLHVADEYQYPAVARAALGVFARVHWLAHLFDFHTGPLKRGLDQLAQSGQEHWPNFAEPTGIEPLRALYAGREGSDPVIDPLLALLIAGAAQSDPKRPSTPQWRELKTLSIAIHRVTKRENRPLRTKLAVLRPDHSRLEVLLGMDAIWESGRDHLSLHWRAVWKPWLSKTTSAVANPRDPNPDPGARARVRSPTPPDREPRPIEIPVLGLEAGQDSSAEVSTSFLFDLPRIRAYDEPKATRASRIASALGSFYQRNGDLLCDHIEVLTESELRPLLQTVTEDLRGLGTTSNATRLCALCARLGLETSFDPETLLAATLFGEGQSDSELMLDLRSGDLVFPVLDPGVWKCPPEAEELFEENADYVRQPLSDGTVWALRKTFAANAKAISLRDCNEAPSNKAINDYLGAAARRAGLDPTRCTLTRLLRVGAVRIQNLAVDRAATMLATNNSVGISTAPVHYYSPFQSRLDELYRNAIWTLFPQGEAKVERDSLTRTHRVGPAHVVKKELAKAAVQALSNRLNTSVAREDVALCSRLHNRFCTYVLHYFLIISSHRVEKSLFTLTRRSFDLANFICFVEDKKVDPAHWPRLVGITAKFARQIWLYLDHLRELRKCERIPAETKETLERMFGGDAPLFRHLDAFGNIIPPAPEWWSLTLPKTMMGAPDNWHRTFSANYLREHAVSGTAVLTQLGHLSAAGFPFGRESVLPPLDLAASIRKGLTSLERDLGFELRAGLSQRSVRNVVMLPDCTPPLRDWYKELDGKAKALRALQEKNRIHLGSRLKDKREAADKWLLATAHEVNSWFSQLVQLVLNGTKAQGIPTDLKGKRLPSESLKALIDANERDHAGDESTRIAVWNRLSSLLHWSARKIGLRCDDIGRIRPATHGPISPFIVEHGLISEQAEALRRCLPNIPDAWLPLPGHVRRALGMMLFGGPIVPRDIHRLAVSGMSFVKPATPPTVLIATNPTPGGTRQALIGHAAIAFFYSSDDPPLTTLTYESFCKEVSGCFKAAFVGKPGTRTFEQICKTLELARDVEIPGFSRALYWPSGAKELSPALQLAFLNKERPDRASLEHTDFLDRSDDPLLVDAGVAVSMIASNASVAPMLKSTSQHYKDRLLEALRNPARVLSAEVSGDNSPGLASRAKTPASAKRKACTDAVNFLMSKRPRDYSIIQALYDFTLEQLINGTRLKRDPLPVSIYAYITSIAADLLSLFDGEQLLDLGVDDLEDAFSVIIENADSEGSQKRKAEQLKEFHRFLTLSDHWRLEPIDDQLFDQYLESVDSRPDANLVTGLEIEMAVAWLNAQCDPSSLEPSLLTARWRRKCWLAAGLLLIFEGAGSRISELAWLRHRDLLVVPDDIVLIIRPSRFRSLKTGAGKRLLRLSSVLNKESLAFVRGIIEAERRRIKGPLASEAFFFADADSPSQCLGTPLLRKLIQIAFKEGADCDMWPHLLRHSRANDGLLALFGAMETTSDLGQILRSSKQLAADIGHRNLRTTGRHYFHLPALTHQLARDLRDQHENRTILKILTGMNLRAVDARYRRACDGHPDLRDQWSRAFAFRIPSNSTVAPALRANPFEPPQQPLSFVSLRALLHLTGSYEDILDRGAALGLSRPSCASIWRACEQVRQETDYRLVPLPASTGKVNRDETPRNVDPRLEAALVRIEPSAVDSSLLGLLATCYSPFDARLNRLRGSIESIRSLQIVCESLDLPSDLITVSKDSSGKGLLTVSGPGKLSAFGQLVAGLMTLACRSLCLRA